MVKAIIFHRFGGPEVLEVTNDFQLPKREAGEVIVNVHSTSVNPVDYKMRNSDQFGTKLPRVLGGDVAGIVAEDGKTVKKGDRIIALTDRFSGPKPDGSYAEQAYVNEDWIAAAPKNLSLETAAGAVPLVSLTAFQALESANLKHGNNRVLVTAASGGVGVFVVQLAKLLHDSFVVGTTGPKNLDFVKSLGADEVVNYREEDFAELYKDPAKHFDVVVDLIGGETEDKAYTVVKKGGTYAHIINTGTSEDKIEAGKSWPDKRYTVTFVQPNGRQLKKVVELIEADKLKVPIHKVWPLEQAAEAQKEVENGHSRGKNVLQVATSTT